MNILIQRLKSIKQSMPKGIFVLLYTEFWELFGRFGITAILVLYLTKTLHFTDARAFTIYATFIALIFVTPVIGGFLCDHYLGKKHAMNLGIIMMACGNLILVIRNPVMVYLWPGRHYYR